MKFYQLIRIYSPSFQFSFSIRTKFWFGKNYLLMKNFLLFNVIRSISKLSLMNSFEILAPFIAKEQIFFLNANLNNEWRTWRCVLLSRFNQFVCFRRTECHFLTTIATEKNNRMIFSHFYDNFGHKKNLLDFFTFKTSDKLAT